tara:strand:+ start:2492 stop:3076 length:585 start_codon:yes stop_codon:yes gene_type:complete
MALPTPAELKKKEDFKISLQKKTSGGRLSEKQMCSIIRTSVRKSWMMSPIRLLKLELARLPDMNPTTRTKWLCECENCNGMFKMTDIEVDHKKGEHKLLSLADSNDFARSILDVTLDDLQIFCKPCHETKTYSERYNITFEEAKIEKMAIALMKKYSKAVDQKKYLTSKGFSESLLNNPENRRDCFKKVVQTQH